jgi:hypothetical protein
MRQIHFRTGAGHSASPARNLSATLVGVAGIGLVGLLLATTGCGSDASSSGGSAGKGGSASSMGGSTADGGKPSGGSSMGGSTADGGATDNAGSTSGGSTLGGSSTGGKPAGGSPSGGDTGSGGGIWGCVEAGGACICQNNTDKAHESVCTGTYKCCVTVPFAGAIRCQCQDPGNQKCEAPAGSGAKVVDKCPPP